MKIQAFWERQKATKPGRIASTTFFVITPTALIPGVYMYSIPISVWAFTMGMMLIWVPSWEEATTALSKWWWRLTVIMAPFALINQGILAYLDETPLRPANSYFTTVTFYILPVFAAVLLARTVWRLPMAIFGSLALMVYSIPGIHLNFIDGWEANIFALPWWTMTVLGGIILLGVHGVRLTRNRAASNVTVS